MAEAVFIDTWGWLALGHHRDNHHQEVRNLYKELRSRGERIFTSDYVLDEVITLLFRREKLEDATHFMEGIFLSAKQGHLTIERVTSERFATAWEFRKRFQDKPHISFTDLTSLVIMEKCGIKKVLTGDEHFVQVGMGFWKMP